MFLSRFHLVVIFQSREKNVKAKLSKERRKHWINDGESHKIDKAPIKYKFSDWEYSSSHRVHSAQCDNSVRKFKRKNCSAIWGNQTGEHF